MAADKSYWNNRVKKYGHTGWADEAIYEFDQPIRLQIADNLICKNRNGKAGGDCPKTGLT